MTPTLPSPAVPTEVTTVAWPERADLRAWLADRHEPRLLLVAAGAPAPRPLDELEDWMRRPADPGDVAARSEELLRRAQERARRAPVVDADGLLRYDGRWVAIPEGQVEVARLLVDRLGRVVGNDVLREAYEAAGGSGHPNSMRTLVARLNRRVHQVGLTLVTVRARGVLLATTPPSGR
jgi:hypothetical protein